MDCTFPDDWFIEHDGQRLILDQEKVCAEMLRLTEYAGDADLLRAEIGILKVKLEDEYERGYREALEIVANEVDCGGPDTCNVMKMSDGSCIRSCSGDCQHDEAAYIRSLKPPARD